MKRTISTEIQLQHAIGELRAEWKQHRYLKIETRSDKRRSTPQNALSHTFYEQIARELGEDTPEGVKCECKLRFGVPIMRRDDEEFRLAYDAALKGLPYEKKLQAMRLLPVTSLMNTGQLSEYLETVAREYAPRGVVLEFPDERAAA